MKMLVYFVYEFKDSLFLQMIKYLLTILLTIQCSVAYSATFSPIEYTLQPTIVEDIENAKTLIKWRYDSIATSYKISYREVSGLWSEIPKSKFIEQTTLNKEFTEYAFENYDKTKVYEFQIEKEFKRDKDIKVGYTYFTVNSQARPINPINKILLLVDNSYSLDSSFLKKLEEYRSILNLNGWESKISYAPRVEVFNAKSVILTKSLLESVYRTFKYSSVLIIGRVAMPYSGFFAVDAHPDHVGAWPTDAYYADLDNDWIDTLAIGSQATEARQHQQLADGKLDNNIIGSRTEVNIGRIDFSNLPFFNQSEIELTIRYLNKNIKFRLNGEQSRKGILTDGFGDFSGRAFAASGFDNLGLILSRQNIKDTLPIPTIFNEDFLLGYACGGGGPTQVGGYLGSDVFPNNVNKIPFYGLFGSYFGDVDYQNNLMRSYLAGEGKSLISYWANRPNWRLYRLPYGANWGQVLSYAQNTSDEYIDHFDVAQRYVHIALLGDPTLEIYLHKGIEILNENNEEMTLKTTLIGNEQLSKIYIIGKSKAFNEYSNIATITSLNFSKALLDEFSEAYAIPEVLYSTNAGVSRLLLTGVKVK